MFDFFNGLNWAGAFTIVGSVGTIVLGVFGYMMKIRSDNSRALLPHPVVQDTMSLDTIKTMIGNMQEEINTLHSRTVDTKQKSAELNGDIRVLQSFAKQVEKQIADHERRDIEDFKVVQAKIDKLMDIVIQILQDDKL